jgi:hypothetical protein
MEGECTGRVIGGHTYSIGTALGGYWNWHPGIRERLAVAGLPAMLR